MTDLTATSISAIDASLLADIDGLTDGIALFTAPYAAATVANQHFQVAYSAEAGRAGIVFVGSGSGAAPVWTDCTSAENGFARFLADEIVG